MRYFRINPGDPGTEKKKNKEKKSQYILEKMESREENERSQTFPLKQSSNMQISFASLKKKRI